MKYIEKALAFILATLLFMSMSNCGNSTVNINSPNTTASTVESQPSSAPEWFTDYASILDEYRKFANYSIEGGYEKVIETGVFCAPDNQLQYEWYCMLGETNIWSYRVFPKTRDAFGYAIADLNGDGQDELILLLQDYTVLAVFTTYKNQPKLLDAYWPRHRCAIDKSGSLLILSSNSAKDWDYTVQQISLGESELLDIEKYGSKDDGTSSYYYKVLDGEMQKINESELNQLYDKYPILSEENANNITKNAGLNYCPLFD